MSADPQRRRGLAAPLALPAGFAALLLVGAVAAAGHASGGLVLVVAAGIVAVGSAVAEPAASAVLAVIRWPTVGRVSRAPHAPLPLPPPAAPPAAPLPGARRRARGPGGL